MKTAVAGIEGVVVWQDDIVVGGHTIEEHNERLNMVLSRLRECSGAVVKRHLSKIIAALPCSSQNTSSSKDSLWVLPYPSDSTIHREEQDIDTEDHSLLPTPSPVIGDGLSQEMQGDSSLTLGGTVPFIGVAISTLRSWQPTLSCGVQHQVRSFGLTLLERMNTTARLESRWRFNNIPRESVNLTTVYVKEVFKLDQPHGLGYVYITWQNGSGSFLATTGNDKVVAIFNRNGKKIEQIGLSGMCTGFGWDADGDLLAIIMNDYHHVVLWDANTGKSKQVDTGLRDTMSCVIWAKRGPILAIGTARGNLTIYNHNTAK
uniref:WDR19 first beta-propeller domain-containing protein n=1 Tax=Timema tahoe TaxID=61484 RepID=A0A7R9FJH0_9NEOP|nr:unnamed protein product [Timema tahoe]